MGPSTKRASAKRSLEQDGSAEKKDEKRVKNKDGPTNSEKIRSSLTDEGWKSALKDHFQTASFRSLSKFVAQERVAQTIFPPEDQTWTALNVCPLEKVRVVIVGQDPYHGPDQAHGLCFSVLPGQKPPPSLKNMYKELTNDPKITFQTPTHGHLLRWARQGVLLLNTVMTVQKGKAHSHKKKGWEDVTDEILRKVIQHSSDCVFLLWGKPATAKAMNVLGENPSHTIICTSHPSPLGATKTDSPFIGSRCFGRCNEALEKMGCEPIDWNLDGSLPSDE